MERSGEHPAIERDLVRRHAIGADRRRAMGRTTALHGERTGAPFDRVGKGGCHEGSHVRQVLDLLQGPITAQVYVETWNWAKWETIHMATDSREMRARDPFCVRRKSPDLSEARSTCT